MSWQLLLLISIITASVSVLFQRALLKQEESDPVAYAVAFSLVVSLLIFIYSLFFGFSVSGLEKLIFNLVFLTVLYGVYYIFMFKAYKLAEASEVTILFSTRGIWTIIAAALFLSESITLEKVAGSLLIILGGVALVARSAQQFKLKPGYSFALLAAIFFGVAFTNDAFILNHNINVPSFLAVDFLLPTLVLLAYQPAAIKKLGQFVTLKRLVKLGVAGVFWGIAAITIFLAFQAGTDISLIAPLSQSSIVVTVILAYIFLKERDRLINKIIGTILVFGGVLLLV